MTQFDFSPTINNILDAIAEDGCAIIEDALPKELINALHQQAHSEQSSFNQAKIGRQNDTQLETNIRSDKTKWFNGETQPECDYLALMEQLREQINRSFYLGLFDYECHFARYNEGDFYKKHLDAFKGKSNRVFTTVCYLNTPSSGGELIIYNKQDEYQRVIPKAGTLVCFESERFPHEVLAASDTRYSIAGWFRKNNSINGVLDPSQ